MKKAIGVGLALFCTVLSVTCFGQQAFGTCSAAFLNSKKSNRIVLLTPDDQNALPHNEILVN